MDTVWASLADVVDVCPRRQAAQPDCGRGRLGGLDGALQRDGFASLRPPDAPWPARDPLPRPA